jgi:hypothetical protein
MLSQVEKESGELLLLTSKSFSRGQKFQPRSKVSASIQKFQPRSKVSASIQKFEIFSRDQGFIHGRVLDNVLSFIYNAGC